MKNIHDYIANEWVLCNFCVVLSVSRCLPAVTGRIHGFYSQGSMSVHQAIKISYSHLLHSPVNCEGNHLWWFTPKRAFNTELWCFLVVELWSCWTTLKLLVISRYHDVHVTSFYCLIPATHLWVTGVYYQWSSKQMSVKMKVSVLNGHSLKIYMLFLRYIYIFLDQYHLGLGELRLSSWHINEALQL